MPYFSVEFERVYRISVVVEASDDDELKRAIDGTLEEGLDSWYADEGSWECTMDSRCGPSFDPVKSEASGELHGIDRSDPDRWTIVAYCDWKDEPEDAYHA